MVSRQHFHVEEKIDGRAQIQASDGMKKMRAILPLNILDVIQKAELTYGSVYTNSLSPKKTSLFGILQMLAIIHYR